MEKTSTSMFFTKSIVNCLQASPRNCRWGTIFHANRWRLTTEMLTLDGVSRLFISVGFSTISYDCCIEYSMWHHIYGVWNAMFTQAKSTESTREHWMFAALKTIEWSNINIASKGKARHINQSIRSFDNLLGAKVCQLDLFCNEREFMKLRLHSAISFFVRKELVVNCHISLKS